MKRKHSITESNATRFVIDRNDAVLTLEGCPDEILLLILSYCSPLDLYQELLNLNSRFRRIILDPIQMKLNKLDFSSNLSKTDFHRLCQLSMVNPSEVEYLRLSNSG
ncbi:unnamed protein product, partial [Didymodactylos carnosus]